MDAGLRKSHHYWLFVIFMLPIMSIWVYGLASPLIGLRGFDNLLWLASADNFNRFGLFSTRLQLAISPNVPSPEYSLFYRSHPPGIGLLTWLWTSLIGIHEFASRSAPLFASTLSAALMYRLVRKLYDLRTAALSTFFWALTPMIVYFGNWNGYEAYITTAMLATMLLYKSWERTRKKWIPPVLFFISFVAGFIGWSWYVFLGFLSLYAWFRLKQDSFGLWPFVLGGVVSLAIFLLIGIWQGFGEFMFLLGYAALRRAANYTGHPIENPVGIIMSRYIVLITPVVFVFALIGIWHTYIKKRPSGSDMLVAVYFGSATLYTIILWESTYSHEYFVLSTYGGMCIWAAIGFTKTLTAYSNPPRIDWHIMHIAFLGAFLYTSWQWSDRLHSQGEELYYYDWALIVSSTTEEDELIGTNLDLVPVHFTYYVDRITYPGIEPDDALNAITADFGYYIYCGEEVPLWIQELNVDPYTVPDNGDCYLTDLNEN